MRTLMIAVGFSLLLPTLSGAQAQLIHHVIVVLDRSGSMDRMRGELTSDSEDYADLRKMITGELPRVCFEPGAIVEGHPLVKKGDYLSFVGFGIPQDETQLDSFIHILGGTRIGKFGFKYKQGAGEQEFQNVWNKYINGHDFFHMEWSAISLSMRMAVHYLKSKAKKAHKTFVLVVSDGNYNGAFEIEALRAYGNIKVEPGIAICNEVSQMYTEQPQKIFGGDVVVRGRLKMRAFEFVSRNQTNFAISEVIEFSPTEYNFVRKGDSYEFDFPIQYKSNRNTIFELDSVSLAVVDTVSKKTIAEDRTYSDGLKVKLPKSFYDQQQNLKMYMDFQVHQRDPVYGVHLLYPEGNNGLHQSMNVVFEAKRGVLAWGPLGETLYKISASLLGPGVSLNTLFWILLPVVLLLIWFIIYIRRNYSITTAPSNITI